MPRTHISHPERAFWFDMIRSLVDQFGLSHREFARQSGCHRTTLRMILDKTAPSLRINYVENLFWRCLGTSSTPS
jgi:lambda repressor-like predicted transcriptional regulator